MTGAERVQAVVGFSFTERQARFLVLVMQHSGICVGRQYARFTGLAHGGAQCNAFFDTLVRRRYAVASHCVHNRARLYYVHYKPLYRAIGEPNSQWRRPVPAGRVVERLMLLDAALASPGLEWLTTRGEKRTYLEAQVASRSPEPTGGAASPPVSGAIRMPLTRCPIGVDSRGRTVVLYLVTEPGTEGFRAFLQEHAALLDRVPAWTLRIVFPRSLACAYESYQRVLREELETPLHPAAVDELKRLFEHRRTKNAAPLSTSLQTPPGCGSERLDAPRITTLYGRWVKHGDAVFAELASPMISEALETGAGGVECIVLPQTYRHLSPLVGHAARTRETVGKGVEKRDTREDHQFARPQPHSSRQATFSSTSSLL